MPVAKFPLGQIYATRGVINSISRQEMTDALIRHASGDWGDLDPEDKQANDDALKHGGRIFSAYTSSDGIRFWIITEANRSYTTVLLPEEY